MTLEAVDVLAVTARHTRHLRQLVGEPLTPILRPTASKPIILAALQAAEIELLQIPNNSQPRHRPGLGVSTSQAQPA